MKHLLLLLLLVAALACALPVAAAGSSQGNNTITALGVAADPADSTRPVPIVERADEGAPAGAVTSGPATTPTVEPPAPPAPVSCGCPVNPRFLGPPIHKP